MRPQSACVVAADPVPRRREILIRHVRKEHLRKHRSCIRRRILSKIVVIEHGWLFSAFSFS